MNAKAPIIALASGIGIPQIGLGTWPLNDAEATSTVVSALELGYRHIDTAEYYGNETGVGEGIRRSGVPREELFVSSKFNREWHTVSGVHEAWAKSVRRLGLEYLDLFLIHWPNPDQNTYIQAWEGLIGLQEQGRVRSIGVCNFMPEHLANIISATGVPPDICQIQLSPYWVQDRSRSFHSAHSIATESYSPIGRGRQLLTEPVIVTIAEAHGVTPAHVILRWHTQQGLIAIPKSASRLRLAANLDVFGFDLSEDEMKSISELDGKGPIAVDPETIGH